MSHKYIYQAIFIRQKLILFLILVLIFPTTVLAECKVCKKLKTAAFIGVKSVKEYADKDLFTKISNEKKAKKLGLSKFTKCSNISSPSSVKGAACKPVYAIINQGIYFCPSQLKAFISEEKALMAGYNAYTACGTETPTPSPTPTPQATPKPLDLTFTEDAGTRFSNVDAFSAALLSGGAIKGIVSTSNDPLFDPDTLRISDSADNLNFSSNSALTGIAPESLGTFANPTLISLTNGSYVLVYEEIKHISSAGLSISNLMRAESNNGLNFSNVPAFTLIPGGSIISHQFYPNILIDKELKLRMYYNDTLGLKTLTSNDNGVSFSEAVNVSILGRSDNYAPFPSNVSVILDSLGNYRMFFSSPINNSVNDLSIFLAESSDGLTYNVFSPPILTAPEGTSYLDPNAVMLNNGKIRLYYLERSGTFGNVTRNVKSIATN